MTDPTATSTPEPTASGQMSASPVETPVETPPRPALLERILDAEQRIPFGRLEPTDPDTWHALTDLAAALHELSEADWRTMLEGLRTWHRSPDSRLHRDCLALADLIEAGAR